MQKHTRAELENLNWDDLRYFLEVARIERASGAAKRLGVNHTTVARRVRELEAALGTVLFEKSRADGFVLTAEGQRLLAYADSVETTVQMASEQFTGDAHSLSGRVRIGSTEGFGCFFLSPQLARFTCKHPHISIDLLSVPHFVSLSKREADLVITLEQPKRGQYVYTKLCEYRLKLYGTRDYLCRHPALKSATDLQNHAFISYVDDLAFTDELLYLDRTIPNATAKLCSTSIIAQYYAALQGHALAILPSFIAEPNPLLVGILPDDLVVTRRFWLCCREDVRKLRRITAVWDYLRAVADCNRAFLMGQSSEMAFL